ncbi:hypothetical protein B0H14DRAFT_2615648 [Mycena olivaceomarginata]|nr:hypothetical protein B0H14DRAFT_2615648 [Mycena olivaceomarginata]
MFRMAGLPARCGAEEDRSKGGKGGIRAGGWRTVRGACGGGMARRVGTSVPALLCRPTPPNSRIRAGRRCGRTGAGRAGGGGRMRRRNRAQGGHSRAAVRADGGRRGGRGREEQDHLPHSPAPAPLAVAGSTGCELGRPSLGTQDSRAEGGRGGITSPISAKCAASACFFPYVESRAANSGTRLADPDIGGRGDEGGNGGKGSIGRPIFSASAPPKARRARACCMCRERGSGVVAATATGAGAGAQEGGRGSDGGWARARRRVGRMCGRAGRAQEWREEVVAGSGREHGGLRPDREGRAAGDVSRNARGLPPGPFAKMAPAEVLVAAFPGRPTPHLPVLAGSTPETTFLSSPPASDFSPEFWGLVENRGTKRPKSQHRTLAQQATASRNSSLKYIRSPHGQNTRAASRRPERRRKGARAPPSTLPDVPTPTQRMVELYRQALPSDEPLFKEALRSPDAVDESDLARWKEEPPFVEDEDATDPYSAAYLSFTKSLAAVLHGVRLREQNAEDIQLREAVYTKGRGVVMHQLQQTVTTLWSRWARVETLLGEGKYHPYHQSREYTMLEHYVQWLARTIFHLTYLKFLE